MGYLRTFIYNFFYIELLSVSVGGEEMQRLVTLLWVLLVVILILEWDIF